MCLRETFDYILITKRYYYSVGVEKKKLKEEAKKDDKLGSALSSNLFVSRGRSYLAEVERRRRRRLGSNQQLSI